MAKKSKKKTSSPSIPKEYKTREDKIDYVTDQIQEILPKLDAVEKKGTEYAVQLGQWYMSLKELVKEEKKTKWEDFVKEAFPHVSIRTIQRHMKIAEKVNLNAAPALAFLGQTRLYELAYLAGEDNVFEFLEDHDIEVQIDLEDEDSINSFKHKVGQFTYQQKKEKHSKSKNGKDEDVNSENDDESDDDEISKDKIVQMKKKELVEYVDENEVDIDDDEWKTTEELRYLLIERLGLDGNDNNDNDNNDNDNNDNDNDDNDDDNDNNDNENDDNQKGKPFKKFRKSASSFLESIDSVIKGKKTAKAKQNAKAIEKIVEEVESKLAELKKYRDSLLKKSKKRKTN